MLLRVPFRQAGPPWRAGTHPLARMLLREDP
jgi:hypothetical protein